MHSIHNRDDLKKLKKVQETSSLLRQERLKEKRGKQDFHYELQEVSEPLTGNQKQSLNQIKLESEKQIQALRDSTQARTQAIQDQTRAMRVLGNALSTILQKSIKERKQEVDEITNRNNQVLTNLVYSNTVDSSIVRTVSNLLNDINQSQFGLESVEVFQFFHN